MTRDEREPPEPAIFTPSNEPYLGSPSLQRFDEVLCVLMAEQHRIGPWTRSHDMTPLQLAACEIVPGACSLAFSVRELVRQGYLLGAQTLLRPLIERVSTFAYLIDHEDAVELWRSGWPHGSRPSLQQRLRSIGGASTPEPAVVDSMRQLLADSNSLVHGDPQSALNSSVVLPDGSVGYAVSKDVASPARAAEICSHALAFAMVLTVRCESVFPRRG